MSSRLPDTVADKYAREWLAARPEAVRRYAARAPALAQMSIDAKAKMIANWLASVNGGRWETALGAPDVPLKTAANYAQKVARATITPSHKLKVGGHVVRLRDIEQYSNFATFAFLIRFGLGFSEMAKPDWMRDKQADQAVQIAMERHLYHEYVDGTFVLRDAAVARATMWLRDNYGFTGGEKAG